MTQQIQITHDQARALAALLHHLRGDWDERGITTALFAAKDRGGNFDLCTAAIRAASTPATRTPAVIAMAGPHWRLDEAMPDTRPKPKGPAVHQLCDACRTPHKPGTPCDIGRDRPRDPDTTRALADRARAALRGGTTDA